MVIHNEKYTSKLKIKNTFSAVALLVLCVYVPLAPSLLRDVHVEINPLAGWQNALIILALCAIYAVIVYMVQKRKLFFVYVSDEDKQNLVFRYYQIHLLKKKCVSYKIPFGSFKKYEIVNDGKHTSLILYQKTQTNQLAKYPAIYLNALNDEEIAQIKDLLNQYC